MPPRSPWLALLLAGCGSGAVVSSRDAAADPGAADAPAGDGPAQLFLTVDELPEYLNGSVPYRQADGGPQEFRVRVNRANFTLDLTGADPAAATVTCDQPFALPAGTIAPGAPLAPAFAPSPAGGFRILVTGPALPDGATVTCQANAGGARSAVTFLAATLSSALDPFPRPDVWLVTLSRDLFRVETAPAPDGTTRVTSVYLPAGNGEADFDEPLYALGLLSRKDPEAARLVKARLLAELREKAQRIFGLDAAGAPGIDGVPIELWFEGEPGAPLASGYASGGFSISPWAATARPRTRPRTWPAAPRSTGTTARRTTTPATAAAST